MATVIAVRLRNIAKQLWFDPEDTQASSGDHVVVKTERGVEMGLACSDAFEVSESDLRAPLKPVLRVATEDDLERARKLGERGKEALPVFRELARKYELDMKPVDVEFLFGGDKAVFYFTSEERVDFRGLVRELASAFHIRIDMRQIGVRDETQLIGGIAPCGQELCCVRMGGEFKPVSIRMAKEQDLPLNPLKISGFCGRLMCCLRYEYDAYKDFKSRAPKKNALIETPLGMAKVVGFDTPKEEVELRLEDGKMVNVPLSEMGYADGTFAGDYDDHAPAAAAKQGKGADKGADGASPAGAGAASGQEASPSGDAEGAPACYHTASGKPPCPGRPCLVTRTSLELHGNTQIAMALAAYDREHGLVPQDDYADDLVDEVKAKPRRRHRSNGAASEPSRQAAPASERKPRRRHAQKSDEPAAEQPAKPSRRRRRSHPADVAQHPENGKQQAQRPGKAQNQQARPQGQEAQAAGEGQQHRSPRRRHRGRGGAGHGGPQPGSEQAATQVKGGQQTRRQDGAKPHPGQHSSGLHQRRDAGQAADGGQPDRAPSAHRRRRRRRSSGSGGGATGQQSGGPTGSNNGATS